MAEPVRFADDVQTQPWGGRPPPPPDDVDPKLIQQLATTWKLWGRSHARPTYIKVEDTVLCSVDYKGKLYQGRSPIRDDNDHTPAAWWSLNACIESWIDDTNVFRAIRRRLRGRRNQPDHP